MRLHTPEAHSCLLHGMEGIKLPARLRNWREMVLSGGISRVMVHTLNWSAV